MATCGALIKQARSLVGRAVRPALLLVHSSPTLSSSRKKLDLSELLPVVARTTKQASCSSTVQGGGKRAAQTLGGWPRFLDLFSHLTTTAEVLLRADYASAVDGGGECRKASHFVASAANCRLICDNFCGCAEPGLQPSPCGGTGCGGTGLHRANVVQPA